MMVQRNIHCVLCSKTLRDSDAAQVMITTRL